MTSNQLDAVAYPPGKDFELGFDIRTDVGLAGDLGSTGGFGWGSAYHSTYRVYPAKRLVVVYTTQPLPAGDIHDHGKL